MRFFRFDLPATFAVFFLLASCNPGPQKEDLQHLQGYWEITRVIFPDGTEKEYKVSSTIEYLQWDGTNGFRKKMQPTLEGTYRTSDDALPMEVIWRDDRLFLKFDGTEDTWEEEILRIEAGKLIMRHGNGLKYIYQKYEPMTIGKDNV